MTTKPLTTSSRSPAGAPVSESTLLDQAYHQYCLLEEAGAHVRPEEFLGRYPTIRSTLGRLLDLHHGFVEETRQVEASVVWPKVGDHFFGFQLERRLGEGASSRVFLATEPALGKRKVAVKITRQGDSEAYTLGRIKHPNVIPIHSRTAVPEQNLSIICMEYLGSATLGSLLDRVLASPKPPADASVILDAARDPFGNVEAGESLRARFKEKTYEQGIREFFANVCLALEYLHGQEILHRDLKPSNILMRSDGSPVLLDFHLASDRQGLVGSFGGTYPYMPPEQLHAMTGTAGTPASAVDEQSDLFAVGVLLWETLTGVLPFGSTRKDMSTNEAVAELLARQQAGFQAPMRAGWSVSPDLVALVRRCLSSDPSDRPASAAELRRLLVPELKRSHSRKWIVAASAVMVVAATLWGALAALAPIRDHEVAARYREGVHHFQAGDYNRAGNEFKWVTIARPKDSRGLRAFAIALTGDGTTDKGAISDAINACQSANNLLEVPDFALTGYLLQLRGDAPREVKPQYDFALSNEQSTKAVLNNLSALLTKDDSDDNIKLAKEYADRALGMDPNCQPALINRALALYKKATAKTNRSISENERDELRAASAEDLKKALSVGPRSGELHYQFAKVMAYPKLMIANDHREILVNLADARKLGIDLQDRFNKDPWSHVRGLPAYQALLEQKVVTSPDSEWKRLIAPYAELPEWDR